MDNELLQEEIRILKEKVEQLESSVAYLRLDNQKKDELIKILRILHFGTKSEKRTKEDTQTATLFNEAEDTAFKQDDEAQQELVKETKEVSPYTRTVKTKKEAGRKPFDPSLPRTVIEYDIPEEEKICPCGCQMKCIGEDVSERAKIYPPKIEIIQEKKKKYVCSECEGLEREDEKGVVTAEGEKHLIPGSCADESLLAWSISEKFEYALPFYRQAIRLKSIGLPIPRATLSNLAVQAGQRCKPLYQLLKETVLSGSVINADETRVQVLNEKGRDNKSLSWMWVFLGGASDKKAVQFQYEPGRSHSVPYEFLKNYSGWLQTDDYEAYHTALKKINTFSSISINHALCWAHARRLFYRYWETSNDADAKEIIDLIGTLFDLENLRAHYSERGFMKQRKNRSEQIFKNIHTRLLKLLPQAPPGLAFGKAINYTLDNWEQLTNYVEHSDLTPSNNIAERAVRPFVIGRKNWLFSGSPTGAESSAILYSLIESAKLHKLVPIKYLYYIFRKIPYCTSEDDFRALLPFNIDPAVFNTDW